MPATLSATLANRTSKYSQEDEQWVHFVRDHLSQLKAASGTLELSPEDTFHYRYRPDLFLASRNHTPNPMWITLLINDMSSFEEFIGVSSFNIFIDSNPVPALYQKYLTYRKQLNNAA